MLARSCKGEKKERERRARLERLRRFINRDSFGLAKRGIGLFSRMTKCPNALRRTARDFTPLHGSRLFVRDLATEELTAKCGRRILQRHFSVARFQVKRKRKN